MHPKDGRVISNFIVQALMGNAITIYGDGQQTRSFCYVDDMVNGIISLMNLPERFTGPVNLGNPVEKTIVELANMIIELTGSGSKIVFKPLPSDDPVRRRPDIKLATEKLDWAPNVELETGLRNTIGYFDELLRSGGRKDLEFNLREHSDERWEKDKLSDMPLNKSASSASL
jgi:UDP-glucuronate decarboxylase